MSCQKCGTTNTSCGCKDTAYTTVKTFTCPPDTLCPTPIKCSQFFDAACVYLTDGIVDAGIQPGSSLESIVQQLVLLVTNPGCVDAPGGVPGGGTVTSVALDMPPAFTVIGSPIQNSGTFIVSVNGNSGQYIDGTGNLQDFPVAPSQVLFQTNNTNNTDQTLLNLVAGSANVILNESGGTVTIDVPAGQQYISTNGIEERPAATFRLGGALVEDTTITGAGNSFTLSGTLFQTFNSDRLDIVTSTSGAKMGSTGGVADSSVEVTGTAATLQSLVGGSGTRFIAESGKLKLQTAAYSAASNNDVLTLIDKSTGEVEYRPPSSGIVLRTNNTNNASQAILNLTQGSNMTITDNGGGVITFAATGIGVTNVSVASANGLAGTVASPGTTPIITLSTTVGSPGTPVLLKGNGTAITAAVAGTDYTLINGTGVVRAVGTALTYINGLSTQYIRGDGTLGDISGIVPGNGTLTTSATTTGATNTSVSLSFSGAFSANTSNNVTVNAVVGLGLANYVTQLANGSIGLLGKTGADTITIDTATYLTSATGVVSVSGGATGLTPSSATNGVVTLGGNLGVGYGGTGVTSTPGNGQLLIGNGTGYSLATLTQGSGISITNSAGGIEIGLLGGVGSVTTFNTSIPGLSPTVGSTGNVTLSGTVGIGGGGTGQTTAAAAFNALSPIASTGDLIIGTGANAASRLPIGANGYFLVSNGTTATWQNVTASGVTTWSGGTTGLLPAGATSGAVTLTGTLAIANGGTGQTTKVAAFDALSPTTTAGDLIYYNGTDNVRLGVGTVGQVLSVAGGIPAWQTITGAVTSFQTSLSGLTPNTATTGVVTLTGTLGVASGGTGATTLTGVVIGAGTTAMTAVAGTANQILRRNGANNGYEFYTLPAYLTSNQTITISGAATGSGTTSIPITLVDSGVVAGTYNNLTVNAKGIVTGGTNVAYLTTNQTITLGTDLSGSGTTLLNATIVANAVTTGKIADSNVTTAKIANANVTTAKIADANVTYAKIQNVAANSFLANITNSATAVQAIPTSRIPLFSADIGGTPSVTTYLDGSGNWSVPSSSTPVQLFSYATNIERANNVAVPSWGSALNTIVLKITGSNGGVGWPVGSYNIITGLTPRPEGTLLTIVNTGNNLLILEHQSVDSLAANRLFMSDSMAFFLMPTKSVTFYSTGLTSGWRQLHQTNPSGFDHFDDYTANGVNNPSVPSVTDLSNLYYNSSLFASRVVTGATALASTYFGANSSIGTGPLPEFTYGGLVMNLGEVLTANITSGNYHISLHSLKGNISGNGAANNIGNGGVNRNTLFVNRVRFTSFLPRAADDYEFGAGISAYYSSPNGFLSSDIWAHGWYLRRFSDDPTANLSIRIGSGVSVTYTTTPLTAALNTWYTLGQYLDPSGNYTYFYYAAPNSLSPARYNFAGYFANPGGKAGGLGIGMRKWTGTSTGTNNTPQVMIDYTGVTTRLPTMFR